jgi:hypothetical protein
MGSLEASQDLTLYHREVGTLARELGRGLFQLSRDSEAQPAVGDWLNSRKRFDGALLMYLIIEKGLNPNDEDAIINAMDKLQQRRNRQPSFTNRG